MPLLPLALGGMQLITIGWLQAFGSAQDVELEGLELLTQVIIRSSEEAELLALEHAWVSEGAELLPQ